eukprot:c14374_g1_i1.p1 GENE.c14374_g1_i1~~c14374_g1_i1.p1  ORF type:complete len:291 (-),score=75.59 c14374_g1_i1:51-923(-)
MSFIKNYFFCFIICSTLVVVSGVDFDILKTINEKPKHTVQEFNGDTIYFQLKRGPILLMFTLPTCKECEFFKYKFLPKISDKLFGTTRVGTLNCAHPANQEICQSFQITSVPTFWRVDEVNSYLYQIETGDLELALISFAKKDYSKALSIPTSHLIPSLKDKTAWDIGIKKTLQIWTALADGSIWFRNLIFLVCCGIIIFFSIVSWLVFCPPVPDEEFFSEGDQNPQLFFIPSAGVVQDDREEKVQHDREEKVQSEESVHKRKKQEEKLKPTEDQQKQQKKSQNKKVKNQ